MRFGLAALSLTHAVAMGAEAGEIVLNMRKEATSSQLPDVSGYLSDRLSLVSTSLKGDKGQSIITESESGSFPNVTSDYKKSYYSPNIVLSDTNALWAWSLVFTVNEDINLTQTQVAFSCDKTSLPNSCKATDFTIRRKDNARHHQDWRRNFFL